jgi:hypothetical protein
MRIGDENWCTQQTDVFSLKMGGDSTCEFVEYLGSVPSLVTKKRRTPPAKAGARQCSGRKMTFLWIRFFKDLMPTFASKVG